MHAQLLTRLPIFIWSKSFYCRHYLYKIFRISYRGPGLGRRRRRKGVLEMPSCWTLWGERKGERGERGRRIKPARIKTIISRVKHWHFCVTLRSRPTDDRRRGRISVSSLAANLNFVFCGTILVSSSAYFQITTFGFDWQFCPRFEDHLDTQKQLQKEQFLLEFVIERPF